MLDPRDIAPEQPRPIRRTDLARMVDAGMFTDERVELLDGVLVEMTPHSTHHASVIQRLGLLLTRALDPRAAIRIQLSYAAAPTSQPEPDLWVGPPGDYLDEHPAAAWLIVEVAHDSAHKDLGYKAELYAGAHVEEYWVVDLVTRRVVVHRDPKAGRWSTVRSHDDSARLSLARFPDFDLAAADILP